MNISSPKRNLGQSTGNRCHEYGDVDICSFGVEAKLTHFAKVPLLIFIFAARFSVRASGESRGSRAAGGQKLRSESWLNFAVLIRLVTDYTAD